MLDEEAHFLIYGSRKESLLRTQSCLPVLPPALPEAGSLLYLLYCVRREWIFFPTSFSEKESSLMLAKKHRTF